MDAELKSMQAIAEILADLDAEVVDRVLRWASGRHGSGLYLSGTDLEALEMAGRAGDQLHGSDPTANGRHLAGSGRPRPEEASPGSAADGAEPARSGPDAPGKEDRAKSGQPSFLDTQYRMAVAKNLIDGAGDDDR